MASKRDIEEFLKHIDDLKSDEFRDIYLVLQGKRAIPGSADLHAFNRYCCRAHQVVVKTAARQLIADGEAVAVLDVLDGILERLSIWGEARRTRIRHTEPSILVWRALANAIAERDFKVAGWLLGIELPQLPGIAWNHVALVIAELTNERSKDGVRKLKNCLKALQNARPFKEALSREFRTARTKRARTKKGMTPEYLAQALILLRNSDGKISAAKVAAEIGVHRATLSRLPAWRKACSAYVRARSGNAQGSDDFDEDENEE